MVVTRVDVAVLQVMLMRRSSCRMVAAYYFQAVTISTYHSRTNYCVMRKSASLETTGSYRGKACVNDLLYFIDLADHSKGPSNNGYQPG